MRNRVISLLSLLPLVVALAVPGSVVASSQPFRTISDPGFRHYDYFDPTFAAALETATIAVLPTIVRRKESCACSFDSQQQILDFLGALDIAAVRKAHEIDLGPTKRPSQWKMFQYGATCVSETLQTYDPGTDYTLVMEILVPDNQAVFGIEVYIVDSDGKHMLSFLLNSHHQMFVEAELVAHSPSGEARNELLTKATAVGLAALQQQLDQLRTE